MKKVISSFFLVEFFVAITFLFNINYAYATCENPYSSRLDESLNQYWEILDSSQTGLDITGDMTISMWIKLESGAEKQLFSKWNHVSQTSYLLTTTGTNLQLYINSSGSGFGYKSAYAPHGKTLDEWFHFAVVYTATSGTAEFFVDGVFIGGGSGLPTSIADTDAPFRIGAYATPSSYFDGNIDDVRIWSRSLSETEIASQFYSPSDFSNGDNLEGYWKFDNNGNDSSGNGNHLANVNNAGFVNDTAFGDCDTKDGLYTQIISPYPSEEETELWANSPYAGGGVAGCPNFAACGCAVTSMVMAGRNAGIKTDVLGDNVDPYNMNQYLTNVGGYPGGVLSWLAAQSYLGEYTSGGQIASRFGTAYTSLFSGAVLDTALTTGSNAVLAYKDGHFIWVPEKTDDSYIVRDPLWYKTVTANDQKATDIRDYNNSFDSLRIFPIFEQPVVLSEYGVEAIVSGSAELLYRKATGELVGYSNGGIVIELDSAWYGGVDLISIAGETDTDKKRLLVPDSSGKFTLQVIGTEDGEFSVSFFTIDQYGEVKTFEFSGLTLPGVVTTFTFDLETGEVVEQPITLEDFLSIVDLELEGYSVQQQRFFNMWAEKIFDRMENKTVSQAIQSIETYKKLLIARKVDGPGLMTVLEKLQEQI